MLTVGGLVLPAPAPEGMASAPAGRRRRAIRTQHQRDYVARLQIDWNCLHRKHTHTRAHGECFMLLSSVSPSRLAGRLVERLTDLAASTVDAASCSPDYQSLPSRYRVTRLDHHRSLTFDDTRFLKEIQVNFHTRVSPIKHQSTSGNQTELN